MRIGCSPLRLSLLLTVCVLFTSANARPDTNDRTLVRFYAMGDVPYAPEEDELLPKQIAEFPTDAEFVVHLGDIKGGGPPCVEAVYQKVSGMLSRSVAPVFIIPGDNEWNDCTDPAQAWIYWNRYFSRFDRRWNHSFPLFRQIEHEENFSFVKNGVLFIGLNVVGGLVHDADEWKQRHAAGLKWVRQNVAEFGNDVTCLVLFGHATPKPKQADFFQPFSVEARAFGKPVLYLHGDGHSWIHDRPFAAKNILRIQVDQGGKAPPLKVTVTDSNTQPFRFNRRNGKPAGAAHSQAE